jgi:adenosylhomocysteine nucleosidase
MIGIIGAMKIEVDSIKNMLKNTRKRIISGIEFVEGTLHDREVVVAQCGIGKVFAGMCAQTMILQYPVTEIINIGVAGTLCEELGLLDIAISHAVVEHDMDTSPLGDPVGLISGINLVEIPACERLASAFSQIAAEMNKHSACGVIASGDQFISTPEKKSYIHQTFRAIACEMEGAAIGHVCYVNNIDFVIIRTISDNADETAGSMEYPVLCKEAAKQSQMLIEAYLK